MHTSFMFDDLAWRFAIIYSFIFDVVTLGLISIFAQLKLKKKKELLRSSFWTNALFHQQKQIWYH